MGAFPRAKEHLDQALTLAKESSDGRALAVAHNSLGNYYAAQRHRWRENYQNDAVNEYLRAHAAAEQAGERALSVRALANAALSKFAAATPFLESTVNETFLDESIDLNRKALQAAIALDPPDVNLLLTIASTNLQIIEQERTTIQRLASGTHDALSRAIRLSRSSDDRVALSLASGHLGRLYELQGRTDDAMQLTRQAALTAQQTRRPDLIYRWQWQTGRLLKAQATAQGSVNTEQLEQAILAYERAVEQLKTIQTARAAGHGNLIQRGTFRETDGRLFFEFADAILLRSGSAAEEQRVQQYLRDARSAVELLKTAELDNYFQDECSTLLRAQRKMIEEVAPDTAIIYLIPLPDRVEILLGIGPNLLRRTSKVDYATLRAQSRLFRDQITDQGLEYTYQTTASKLHDWLIKPIMNDLKQHQITTLVFVPDGVLRMIPMAALYDGQRHLIEDYAIAVTPGLTLMEPRPTPRTNVRVLLTGLSLEQGGFPALRYVPLELDSLKRIVGGTELLDEQFVKQRVAREIGANEYSIVHIASHGDFQGDVRLSKVLTYRDSLSLDDIERILAPSQVRDRPVELITLSACETAAGDDRSALGLAGVAIKAGARAAVATLWQVNDRSSATLIADFYQQLIETKLTKAQAMREAQRRMLASDEYNHPYYWAPFLVIGNWL
jgi:CHAT domain-containing protein